MLLFHDPAELGRDLGMRGGDIALFARIGGEVVKLERGFNPWAAAFL
ncbi:MAG: hypothetical protein IT426_12390 [Pirellulales bacterium]|nr:hypothetical protein [Pirellulales bacterium]